MIVVAAGMEKAGTGWYFNMTNDLLISAGHIDIRILREQYRLHSILRHYNCNVGKPRLTKLMHLLMPHFQGNTFVVKTHEGPTIPLSFCLVNNVAKATYIYRDPRAVVLSLFEHGKKIREEGRSQSFANLLTIEDAILYVNKRMKVYSGWMKHEILKVRYEDLKENPIGELERLARYLECDLSKSDLEAINEKYKSTTSKTVEMSGLHFNKGSSGRFKEVLNPQQLELCQLYFGKFLDEMGYV